ncbi:50S ribosomal protein L33 [Brochothrix thermosphacta]|uniref:50S ribosomal protein L33 n=1 Tax=Brochothrix thermosphacta TaxID=2756 RepID=UPI00265D2C03|nr:50S ribosomal protein L33 [Brochothrix thermosphacta]WKK70285.1 50S ribosomal protein L33 [Brochothrix thermosphacta]
MKYRNKRSVKRAKKASLACVECGSRNYTITLGASARTTRLEMNKHCKYCKKHTKHRETK